MTSNNLKRHFIIYYLIMNCTFWFEKYKPTQIEEIVGQDKIKDVLENCLVNKNIPHLLLYGYSGVGKSIIINNFIKQYYGNSINDISSRCFRSFFYF